MTGVKQLVPRSFMTSPPIMPFRMGWSDARIARITRRRQVRLSFTRDQNSSGGHRGQTGLPANFRQKAPEIHGSLVSPREYFQPWRAASRLKVERIQERIVEASLA